MQLSPHNYVAIILISIQLIIIAVARADENPRPTSIDVFTTTAYPLVNHPPLADRAADNSAFEVYIIDHIQRLQIALSNNLPRHPEAAKQQVLNRISDISNLQTKHLENAGMGLAKALHYGIDRYPAIVFGERVVVYGVRDLRLALEHYQQWLEASAS